MFRCLRMRMAFSICSSSAQVDPQDSHQADGRRTEGGIRKGNTPWLQPAWYRSSSCKVKVIAVVEVILTFAKKDCPSSSAAVRRNLHLMTGGLPERTVYLH